MKKDSKTRLFEVMGRLDKTFKTKLNENEESMEEIEPQKDDNEGASYKAKLEEIVGLAKKAYKNLPEGDLPSWIQDKIVIAKEHLTDIYDWMHTKEEEKEGDLYGSNRDMDDDEDHEPIEDSEEDKEETTDNEDENETDDLNKSEEKKPTIPVSNIAKVGK